MMPAMRILSDTANPVRVLTLRGLQSGKWELTDSLGRMGGLFLDMKSAIRFAKLECGQAMVLVDARSTLTAVQ